MGRARRRARRDEVRAQATRRRLAARRDGWQGDDQTALQGTALQGDNRTQRLADGQGATEGKTRRRRSAGHTTAVGLAEADDGGAEADGDGVEADGGGAAGDTNGGGVAGTLRYFLL